MNEADKPLDSQRPIDQQAAVDAATEAANENMAEQGEQLLTPEQEVDALREQVADLEGQVLRGQAELENFRKRVRREMEADRKYAALPLLKDLVGVVDNLQRALDAAQSSGATNDLTQGVAMVAEQWKQVLQQHGCQPVADLVGETFDPNVHEAIAQQPSDEHPPGQIIFVHQVGYQLYDRVVRPAQVIVSSGAPNATNESPE